MITKVPILTILALLMSSPAYAEADFLRSTGKIYVVVGVLVLIFLGLVIYLISMDRKLTKLENQIKNNGQNSYS